MLLYASILHRVLYLLHRYSYEDTYELLQTEPDGLRKAHTGVYIRRLADMLFFAHSISFIQVLELNASKNRVNFFTFKSLWKFC